MACFLHGVGLTLHSYNSPNLFVTLMRHFSLLLILASSLYASVLHAQIPMDAPAMNDAAAPGGTIKTVEVIADITGDSPKDAQEKAIDYAQKRAFFLALYELNPEKAESIAKSLTEETLLRYIRGYEIVQDRTMENRYQAQFKVSLSETQIRQLATDDPLSFLGEVAPRPNAMLVIPVLDNGTDLLLWDGSNVWRSIWNSVALERGEGLLVTPFGDPTDVSWVSNKDVLSSTHESLAPWLGRYGTDMAAQVLVTYALERKPIAVDVAVKYIDAQEELTRNYTFEAANPEDTPELLLIQAASRIAEEIKAEAYKRSKQKQMQSEEVKRQPVRFYFQRLPEWVNVRGQIEKLPNLLKVHVKQIGVNHADIELQHTMQPSMLKRSMEVRGFIVNDGAEPWRVSAP